MARQPGGAPIIEVEKLGPSENYVTEAFPQPVGGSISLDGHEDPKQWSRSKKCETT
jgi:hypothetical protein